MAIENGQDYIKRLEYANDQLTQKIAALTKAGDAMEFRLRHRHANQNIGNKAIVCECKSCVARKEWDEAKGEDD